MIKMNSFINKRNVISCLFLIISIFTLVIYFIKNKNERRLTITFDDKIDHFDICPDVTYNGVVIGKVKVQSPTQMIFLYKESIKLPKDTQFMLKLISIMGEYGLNIELGQNEAFLLGDGDSVQGTVQKPIHVQLSEEEEEKLKDLCNLAVDYYKLLSGRTDVDTQKYIQKYGTSN